MTMNPLPPQAYTKETLLKAYQWLQAQPPSIREMAMTPDILVSLFLKATREGDHALERPSIKNFKTELKTLAGLMGELDAPAGASMGAGAGATAASPASAQSVPAPSSPATASIPPPSMAKVAPTADAGSRISFQLDGKSLEFLKEIREDFNLSTDAEALRMLVKIGFSKAKSLVKD